LQTRTPPTPTPYKNSFNQKSEHKQIQPTTHNPQHQQPKKKSTPTTKV
jgi:hypothetical protein